MAIRHHPPLRTTELPRERAAPRPTTAWLLRGLAGGLIAGVVFAMFEMVVAVMVEGSRDAFWNPMRMIGAMVLGEGAMEPGYSLVRAAVTGFTLHIALSAAFGVGFRLLVALVPVLARSAGTLILTAAVYGLTLWLVNFYVIARAAGWDWFPDKADQFWQGFVAHTLFYGAVLGAYLAAARPAGGSER